MNLSLRGTTLTTSLILLTLILSARPASAANQYFMPGDAFFHTLLTEAVIKDMAVVSHPEFTYHRPEFLPRMFCGYAGFQKLEFTNMPQTMRDNLTKVYRELRDAHPLKLEVKEEVVVKGDVELKTGKKLYREINGFNMFFYNADFDRRKHRLGLKYNEQWADQFAAFGHDRKHAIYEVFVRDPEAIMLDWREGKSVSPLNVELPPISTRSFRTPIRPKGKLMAIVSPTKELASLYRGSGKTNGFGLLTMYMITEQGITRLQGRKGHWLEPMPGKQSNVIIKP